jgi:5-methyltetrahydropteroyltriglutamate--homocysteine methyltransferase
MELLDEFAEKDYPNSIGPGVYDVHSPRVPSSEEVETLVNKALREFRRERLWINPDCGLKDTRLGGSPFGPDEHSGCHTKSSRQPPS